MSSVPVGPTTGTYDILGTHDATVKRIVEVFNRGRGVTASLTIRFQNMPIVIEVSIAGLQITNDKINFSGTITKNKRTVFGHFRPGGQSGSITVE